MFTKFVQESVTITRVRAVAKHPTELVCDGGEGEARQTIVFQTVTVVVSLRGDHPSQRTMTFRHHSCLGGDGFVYREGCNVGVDGRQRWEAR